MGAAGQLEIGYHCSHEQWAPDVLLGHAVRAEAAGFRHAMCSDHFHPWSARQGHSGFAWSWLGAALQATRLTFGTVNAPGQRYHPAIVAQAAATLSVMYPDRFWLAVGSGENLNESVTGDPWPVKEVRQRRLQKSAEVMRRLWAGEEVSASGAVRVRQARLWTRPLRPPLLVGAALSEETARFVGGWADALITASAEPGHVRDVARAFADGGGAGRPVFVQCALAWARSEEEGLRAVHHQWRHGVLGRQEHADLPGPDAFDARVAHVGVEEMRGRVPVVTSVGQLEEMLGRLREAGATRVYLHDVTSDVETFIDAVGERLLGRSMASTGGTR